MPTTWNPADKHANIVLSNGDLTAATSGSVTWINVRGTVGKTTGKWYWEVTLQNHRNGSLIGVTIAGTSLSVNLGTDANSYLYRAEGIKYCAGSSSGIDTATVGDVISIALDLDAGKIWFAKNGVWLESGDPANGTNPNCTGLSDTFYAVWGANYSSAPEVTANFGTSAFAYSVPSGFAGLSDDIEINANVTNPHITAEGFTGVTSEPSIPIMQIEGFTGIAAEPSISMQTVILTGSDNIEHVQATATIPIMSASMVQAEQIWGDVTIPSMTAELTERETTLGEVSIPMMTAELTSGIPADLEVTTPMMTVEGVFSNQCEVIIPMVTVEMEGTIGRVISSDVSVPMMTAALTGKTEHLINGAISVPMLKVSTKLMTGKLIAGAAEIPIAVAALSSYEDITGDINTFIPVMEAYMIGTAERAVCPILRYDDKPDCIGNITEEIPMIEVSLAEA